MTRHWIDHALVMDTDHLRGGGGYAVYAASPGTEEAERVFVAENFGISNYLHDPQNARFYFSVFRVPGGHRTAFVRRFANGTRRNGVQNRLFIHTLFLENAVLEALSFLPWLLAEAQFRIGGSGDAIPLTDNPQPLLKDRAFPELEWDGEFSPADAFEQISMRFAQFGKRLTKIPELAHRKPGDVVASVVEAVQHGGRATLPQGLVFEQLSLLAWSVLPPLDRAEAGWTQHDSGNIGGVTYAVANRETTLDALELEKYAGYVAKKTVEWSTDSFDLWSAFQTGTQHHGLRLHHEKLASWLRGRGAQEALIRDPLARDEILLPPLREFASSIHPEHRDPSIDDAEILAFLWSLITRSIAAGQSREQAITRWISLFEQSDINQEFFRQLPPMSWLDAAEVQVGADLLLLFFLHGTESLEGGAATRHALAQWVIERNASRLLDVSGGRMASLIERLTIDRSTNVTPLIEMVLARRGGLLELAGALPKRKPAIGPAILLTAIAAVKRSDRNLPAFIRSALLPQLEVNPQLGLQISENLALSIGALLRDDPAGFTTFVTYVAPGIARNLITSIAERVESEPEATLPVARAILERQAEGVFPEPAVAELAFAVAETGEAASLWLPFVINLAKETDRSPHGGRVENFLELTARLQRRLTSVDPQALQNILILLRQHADFRKTVGACVHALVTMTYHIWPSLGDALPDAVAQLLKSSLINPNDWQRTVMGIVAARSKNNMPSPGAARLAAAFWNRADRTLLQTMELSAANTLAFVDPSERTRVVEKWLKIVRTAPQSAAAGAVLDTLYGIASSEQREDIEIERIKRPDDPLTDLLYRLDDALLRQRQHDRDAEVSSFIERRLRGTSSVERATLLVAIAASSSTWPTTRRTIETGALKPALRQLRGAEWNAFLMAAENDLFPHDSICYAVARYLGAAGDADAAVSQFEQMCAERERTDAMEVLLGAPVGKIEKLTTWLSDTGRRWLPTKESGS